MQNIVKLKTLALWLAATASVCAGCIIASDESLGSAGPGELDEALVGGTLDASAHPEVVRFETPIGTRCTATMITRRYFVTAAHCIGYKSAVVGGTIHFPFAGVPVMNVDQTFAFAGNPISWSTSNCPGSNSYCTTSKSIADVALGRLSSDAPTGGWTPARIAFTRPDASTTNNVTVIGHGCTSRSNPTTSQRTRKDTAFGNSNVYCPGDDGAPMFKSDGTIGALLVGVNAAGTGDIWADLPTYKLRIQRTIRQLEGGLNPGIDLHDADIPGQAVVITSDARDCRATCQKNASCRAWTWLSGTNRCYQKDATADWTPRDDAVSGTIEPIDPFIWGGLDTSFDLPGSNLPNMPVPANNPADCARLCWENLVCRSYTFVSNGSCWLKGSVPTPDSMASCAVKRTCVSGIRRFAGSRDYSHNDYAGPYASNVSQCPIDCMNSSGCQAFTFWNGSCWQKSPAPAAATIATGLNSDVRSGFYYNSEILNLTAYNTIILAKDDASRPEPQACAAACSKDVNCRSWTMQTPNSHETPNVNCLLYDTVGFAYSRNGAVSGVKALQFW
jgi:V8-like Glu-specific endopeptidase